MHLSPYYSAWIASNLALAYCATGRLAEARETYLGVIGNHPRYARAHIGLCVVNVRLGRLDDAHRAAAELLRLDPQFRSADWARNKPFPDDATVQAFVADMRRAGLP
jgi:tetratricopeptide (TPR) repeat protein